MDLFSIAFCTCFISQHQSENKSLKIPTTINFKECSECFKLFMGRKKKTNPSDQVANGRVNSRECPDFMAVATQPSWLGPLNLLAPQIR